MNVCQNYDFYIFFNIGALYNKTFIHFLFSAWHKIEKILDSLIELGKTQ